MADRVPFMGGAALPYRKGNTWQIHDVRPRQVRTKTSVSLVFDQSRADRVRALMGFYGWAEKERVGLGEVDGQDRPGQGDGVVP